MTSHAAHVESHAAREAPSSESEEESEGSCGCASSEGPERLNLERGDLLREGEGACAGFFLFLCLRFSCQGEGAGGSFLAFALRPLSGASCCLRFTCGGERAGACLAFCGSCLFEAAAGSSVGSSVELLEV